MSQLHPEQQNQQLAQLIDREIRQLKTHPHIQQIISIKPLCYKLIYWPQNIDSLYAQMTYKLKLTIPQNYPQKPPFLMFLDKIYHLNIHPISGQVFMPILKDDWSPFLNFKAIISSLDQVLEQADQSNAATSDLLQLYQYDIDLYIQNVKKTLLVGTVQTPAPSDYHTNFNDNSGFEHEVVQEVIQVKDISYSNFPQQSDLQKTYEFQNNQSMDDSFAHVQQNKNKNNNKNSYKNKKQAKFVQNDDSQNNEAVDSKKVTDSKKSTKNNNYHKYEQQQEQTNNKLNNYQRVESRKILINEPQQSVSEMQYNKILRSSKQQSNSHKKQTFDYLKNTMRKCKQLINIFSQQCQQLDSHIAKIKSKRLKERMEERYNKLQEMIMELFDISQNINLKLMDNVRTQSKKYNNK